MTRGKWLCSAFACATAMAFGAAPASAAPASDFNWTGFYIGGHAGGAFNQDNLHFTDLSDEQDLTFHSSNGNNFMGGVQGGFNWMAGPNTVFGIEGDGSFGSDVDYLASVRARLGWAGSWHCLVYLTGGVAFVGDNQDFTVISEDDGPSHFSRDRTKTGWAGGAGFEWPIMSNMTIGAEGLYYDFGGDRSLLATPPAVGSEAFAVRDDLNFWVARARVTLYLNGP